MAYEATPAVARQMAAARDSAALRAAWRAAWTTRLGVLLLAVFAALTLGPASGGLACENELTHAPAEPGLSPLALLAAAYLIALAAYAGWLAPSEGDVWPGRVS